MRRSLPVWCGVVLILGVCASTLAASAPARTSARAAAGSGQGAALSAAYLRTPLGFLAQPSAAGGAELLARGADYTLAITAASTTLSLSGAGHPARVRMRLLGANPRARAHTSQPQPGRVNELLGSDRARWRVGLRAYARARFSTIWPGIDAVYHGRQRRLEYDFVLAPGADPAHIALGFSGQRSLRLDGAGDLELATTAGPVTELRPSAYQTIAGRRVSVAAGYVVHGSRVSLRIGRYDRARALTIDPLLEYSTFLGGENDDEGNAIAVDSAGDAYVTGQTSSELFPTTEGVVRKVKEVEGDEGGKDAFVTALTPSGQVRYSTYLGGSEGDLGSGIAIDGAGDAYVTGLTFSADFPTQNAAQPKFGGQTDAFVAELSPDGSHLIYSTFLGGKESEEAKGIALDEAGDAFVAGMTTSSDFPKNTGPEFATGPEAFVTEVKAGGASFGYSQLLGASSEAHAIAVNGAGEAFVTGETSGKELAGQSFDGQESAFVTRLNTSGGASYTTNLGGPNVPEAIDLGNGIAIDGAGNAYVTGGTEGHFPATAGSLQSSFSGGLFDAFVAKVDPGGGVGFATYLGGDKYDEGNAIAVDSSGAVYVTGFTEEFSTIEFNSGPVSVEHPLGFPVLEGALGVALDGAPEEAFAAKIDGAGALVYSTPLGSHDEESRGRGIVVDAAGEAFVTGFAGAGFPTTTGPAFGGGFDVFVTRLGGVTPPCTPGNNEPRCTPVVKFTPGPGNPPPSPPPPPKPPAAPSVENYGPGASVNPSGSSTFVYHCSSSSSSEPCEGTMGYSGSGAAALHYLVLAHFKVAAGKSVSVHLRLPKRMLAQLRRRHTLKLTLVITVRQGKLQTVRREPLKLKPAGRHPH